MSSVAIYVAIFVCLAVFVTGDQIYLKVDAFGKWPTVRLIKINENTKQCYFERKTPAIMKILKNLSPNDNVNKIDSEAEFDSLLEQCEKNGFSLQMYNYGANYAGITFPGTKWCGPGDNAANFDDLGTEWEADICCRGHDNCDDMMSPFSKKNNLTNFSIFTKLNCACDDVFIQCLKAANTETAKAVGVFFFNVVQNKCYKYDYPIIKCLEVPRSGSCNKYLLDETKPKVWQWFENISYDVED